MRSLSDIQHDFWRVLYVVTAAEGPDQLRLLAERVREDAKTVNYVPTKKFMHEVADTLDEWAADIEAQQPRR